MINSKKGKSLLKSIKKNMILHKSDIKPSLNNNQALFVSKRKPIDYEEIKKDLYELSFDKFIEKHIS